MIDEFSYWDARVLEVTCSYLADEVKIVYEDEENGNVLYRFLECYDVNFHHGVFYKKVKAYKDLSLSEIPYFLQDVVVEEIGSQENKLYHCKINMWPMSVEVTCKEIIIGRETKSKTK